jgi:hypothetical protein
MRDTAHTYARIYAYMKYFSHIRTHTQKRRVIYRVMAYVGDIPELKKIAMQRSPHRNFVGNDAEALLKPLSCAVQLHTNKRVEMAVLEHASNWELGQRGEKTALGAVSMELGVHLEGSAIWSWPGFEAALSTPVDELHGVPLGIFTSALQDTYALLLRDYSPNQVKGMCCKFDACLKKIHSMPGMYGLSR